MEIEKYIKYSNVSILKIEVIDEIFEFIFEKLKRNEDLNHDEILKIILYAYSVKTVISKSSLKVYNFQLIDNLVKYFNNTYLLKYESDFPDELIKYVQIIDDIGQNLSSYLFFSVENDNLIMSPNTIYHIENIIDKMKIRKNFLIENFESYYREYVYQIYEDFLENYERKYLFKKLKDENILFLYENFQNMFLNIDLEDKLLRFKLLDRETLSFLSGYLTETKNENIKIGLNKFLNGQKFEKEIKHMITKYSELYFNKIDYKLYNEEDILFRSIYDYLPIQLILIPYQDGLFVLTSDDELENVISNRKNPYNNEQFTENIYEMIIYKNKIFEKFPKKPISETLEKLKDNGIFENEIKNNTQNLILNLQRLFFE